MIPWSERLNVVTSPGCGDPQYNTQAGRVVYKSSQLLCSSRRLKPLLCQQRASSEAPSFGGYQKTLLVPFSRAMLCGGVGDTLGIGAHI